MRLVVAVMRKIGYFAHRAMSMEIGVWKSLYRLVFRRPCVPAGATAFSYHKPDSPYLIGFIVISAIEIPIVDLLVHQWPIVRYSMFILGIWGLTFMFGMLIGFTTRPHSIGPDGILVRSGPEVEVALPWQNIDSVNLQKRIVEGKGPFSMEDGVASLVFPAQQEVDVVIDLFEPMTVKLPKGTFTAKRIRLHADDAKSLVEVADGFLWETA